MRYECVHCDERFETDAQPGAEETPRCPKCLRKHGLRKLESTAPGRSRPRWLLPAVAAGILVAAGGSYVMFGRGSRGGLGASANSDAVARAGAAGATLGELARLFAVDAKVEDFAQRTAGSAASAADKAKAIADAVAVQVEKTAFVPWSRADVREGAAPMPASEALAKIEQAGGRAQLYPLEVAAAGVAALRALDVSAQLAEVYAYQGERAALDPSGHLGYYVVLVSPAPNTAPIFLDLYGGRKAAPAPGAFAALDDAQALGAALALRAMHRLVNLSDPAAALADADAAVKLAPSSPTVRGVRGAVLLASGGATDGERELEAAAQLRTDAPRRNSLAMLALAKGDAERAAKETSLALQECPDYAAAHLTLASVHMSRGEADLARSELDSAERIDPSLPALAMAWAELYAGTGDLPHAIEKAEAAVRARPKSPETHLVLGRVYRQAARYDDMRVQARMVLDLAPASAKERTTALLHNLLGPTALEQPTEPAGGSAPALGSPQMAMPEPSDLQLGSGTPKLHLGAGTGKLKLDLGN